MLSNKYWGCEGEERENTVQPTEAHTQLSICQMTWSEVDTRKIFVLQELRGVLFAPLCPKGFESLIYYLSSD